VDLCLVDRNVPSYVPSSRTVCKRNPLEGFVPGSSRRVLLYGSWWGNIVNRKPPRGWGFLLMKVELGIFDFCAISRRLISKDSISSPSFSCGCSYAERALWCRDSKCRALGNYFPVRICYEFLLSKCRGDLDLGMCTFWFWLFFVFQSFQIWQNPIFSAGETHFFSEVALTQWFSFGKYPNSAQTYISVSSTIWY